MSIELNFSTLGLRSPLFTNLASLGYKEMTSIQSQSLPFLLAGKDMVAQSQTGSGKTVAFSLAMLNQLNVNFYAIQALILCPTRELAEQVSQEIRKLARLMHNVKVLNLSGGMPINPQYDSLRHGAHIIVGTPGRVKKHLEKGSLSLKNVRTLILDEADRMLDMGFLEDIKSITRLCPIARQTMLFSATYPVEIRSLAQEFLREPLHITVEAQSELNINQLFYEAKDPKAKYPLLRDLLFHYCPSASLIFCNTKEQTTQVAQYLKQLGFSALTLNGDMEQIDRDVAMIRFANKSCSILVATDVAARGLDIKELPAVINFDIAFDLEVHIHRIGRTGRAGHQGLALNLTTPADASRLCLIEEHFNKDMTWASQEKLEARKTNPLPPEWVTLCLSVGRKDKMRPGDILGALIKDAGLTKESIDKINITTLNAYIAVHKDFAEKAFQHFKTGKLKNRKVLVRKLI